MGLPQLEWHPHKEGWVARVAVAFDTNPARTKYRRFAHVNLVPWELQIDQKRNCGKILAQFVYPLGSNAGTTRWCDSIEDAKLYVEAIYALDND